MEADVWSFVDVFPAQYFVSVYVAVLLGLLRFTFVLEVEEALVDVHLGVGQVVVTTRVEVE